ncbi:MAG: uracil-DNA glycosylase [Actinomycetota bacterium]|nr:uracil-DNA glycosylase [Actinomycetota bacterium]
MPEEDLSQINSLAALEQVVKTCSHCPLRQTRTHVVFGIGNPHSDLVFIGEAPGFHEDRKGEPFVGAAGRLLDELLITVVGLARKDIYIANVLKCRPPNNRDPQPDEIEHCRPFLDKQIELIDPKVICTLGNHATRAVLNQNINISRIHGRPIQSGGRWIFPTYHPAAALYTGAIKQLLIEDFKKLGELLAEDTAPQKSADSAGTEQMGLF